MNSKPIFLTIGIIAILGIVSITFSYGQTALADQGGKPNNSGQAQANADERFQAKMEKALDNDRNKEDGANQALENIRDGIGVTCSRC
ncbi:hypothetical protein [Candidatus Nitrosocosmicus sp. R]